MVTFMGYLGYRQGRQLRLWLRYDEGFREICSLSSKLPGLLLGQSLLSEQMLCIPPFDTGCFPGGHEI